MITRILAVLALTAISFHSAAHNEHSIGSTDIEFYELELRPNETIKLRQLKIYSEKEVHDDEDALGNALPAPPHNINNQSHDLSLTPV
ncbi:hypothetical protein [Pseudomonas putida]|jgi:hypothetical protein|uniref:hypothetical protein n=1 Tax=Pseudomonas putida TaxID=303 RepID=UPI0009811932|nr:hypothetical protein [Pseudomonas putida]OMQ29178.1 hypothetical protein BKX96_30770 [Pseudomonas putida]